MLHIKTWFLRIQNTQKSKFSRALPQTHWGSLQRSQGPLAGGEGANCPLPKNSTHALALWASLLRACLLLTTFCRPWLRLLYFVAVSKTRALQVQSVKIVSFVCLSPVRCAAVHMIWAGMRRSCHRNHCHWCMMLWATVLMGQILLAVPVILSRHTHTFSSSCRQFCRVLINNLHWVTFMHISADIFLSTDHQTKAGRCVIVHCYW